MGTNDAKKSSQGEDAIVYGAVGVVVIGLLLWALARLPFFLMGALIGLMMVSNFNRRNAPIRKLKAIIGTGAACYFVLYLAFGFSGFIKSDFAGALIHFEWYRNAVMDLVIWWNGFIPSFVKGLRVTSQSLTPSQISRFILSSVIAGSGFVMIIPPIFRLIVPKKENSYERSEPNEFLSMLLESPYYFFQRLVEIPLSIAASFGHEFSMRVRGLKISEWMFFLLSSAMGLGVSFLLSKLPSFFNIESKELTFLIGSVFAYAPFMFFITGFVIGLIPVVGDTALFHLFESTPEGAKLIGEKSNKNGFLLGKKSNDRPFFLTERNLAYHVEIVAPTGSGKTNILKNLISDRISKGHGVIFLDYKADFELLNWMYRTSKAFNREEDLRLLSLANPDLSVPYNPLEEGSSSEITSRLMNSFEWSTEQYYLNASKSALSRVMRGFVSYRELTASPFHVGHVHKALTDSNYLRMIAEELKANQKLYWENLIEVAKKIDKPSDAKEMRGLISNLESLMFSSVGPLLSSDTESGAYSLKEAIDEGRITYCLMNSLLLKESSKALGKLILQDLMSFVGRRFAAIEREDTSIKPITLIIDEFAAFAIPEFVDFLDRARSAGIGVIIAHQDRADLKNISPEFQSRVEANTNTTIISGVKDPKDAEHFAGQLGTKTTVKETWQESSGLFGDSHTGMKSKREVEEYVLHPNRIKELKQGEVLAIARTVDPHFGVVLVPRAEEFERVQTSREEILGYFKGSRGSYLKQNKENAFSKVTLSNVRPGLLVKQNLPKEEVRAPQDQWS